MKLSLVSHGHFVIDATLIWSHSPDFLLLFHCKAPERVQQWSWLSTFCFARSLGGFILQSGRSHSAIQSSNSWSKEISCTKPDIPCGQWPWMTSHYYPHHFLTVVGSVYLTKSFCRNAAKMNHMKQLTACFSCWYICLRVYIANVLHKLLNYDLLSVSFTVAKGFICVLRVFLDLA